MSGEDIRWIVERRRIVVINRLSRAGESHDCPDVVGKLHWLVGAVRWWSRREHLHVVERFARTDENTLGYNEGIQ